MTAPKQGGSRDVMGRINGEFGGPGRGGVHGVRGIYTDNENNLVHGAIIGGRRP